MIQLTDTDGDGVFIREEHISFVFVYRPTNEPGVVQHKFKKQPRAVVHTVTGAAIPVLETPDAVVDRIRGYGEDTYT